MSEKWYPIIDQETCIECGRCIEHCCRNVYDTTKARPTVIHPEGCSEGCHGCAKLCPTGSITYFGDDGKEKPCSCNGNCNCGCS